MHHSCPRTAVGAFMLCCAVAAGCNKNAPGAPFETFPVAGKVAFTDARSVEVLERAKVWLQSTANAEIKALGAVGDDGSFVMTVFTKDKTWAGVPAGDYKVCIEPPPDDETLNPRPGVIHPKYQTFDSSGLSVQVPVRGELTFVLQPPARSGS